MDSSTNSQDPNESSPPASTSSSGEFPLPPLKDKDNTLPRPSGPAWSAGLDTTTQPQAVVSPDIDPDAPAIDGDPVPTPGGGTVVSGGFSPPPPASSQPVVSGSYNASPTPLYGGVDPSPPMSTPSTPRSFKALLIALAAVVVIGGGSAAAYFGVIVPNKPANVLKSALVNTLQQKQSSFKGSLEANGGGVALRADINGASNTVAKTADLQLNLTVSGISFPVETRLVNKNVYVKVGDLSTIASLVNAYSPDAGSIVNTVSSQLSNKWIVIDSTLLNESGAGCVVDTNWAFTPADIQLLENQYSKNPFVTIQSTASDMVNGQKAEKFVLSIDDDKAAAAYGNPKVLNNLSLVKAIEKCNKGSSAIPDTSKATGDHQKTPITLWIDKANKRIVKIDLQDNGAKAKQSGTSGSFTTTISYKPVSISAPPNAESAIQVFTDIEKAAASNPAVSNLLGGTTGSNNALSQ
jgi:hypothetical protein